MRPFARSQQDWSHCKVIVPGLHLHFRTGDRSNSYSFRTPSLRMVSRPLQGAILVPNPPVEPVSGTFISATRLHSPSGLATFRIKAFNEPSYEKLAFQDRSI